ncbi:MAG: OmpA family protein [Kineosporiaceae bacterium]
MIAGALAAVLGTAALAAAALGIARGVETRLTSEAQAALAATGIPVTVDYDGRDARVSGTAVDLEAAARAADVVRGIRGTRSVVTDVRVDMPAPSDAAAVPTPAPPDAGPVPAPDVPALPPTTVRFDDAVAELSPVAQAELTAVVDHLLAYPEVRVVIEGHTDGTGSPESNWRLSRQRADAVRAHLMSRGVPGDRMEIALYADTRPVAPEDTADGRAANRRVEVVPEATP